MIAALFALAVQENTVQLGTVDVGGRQTAVTVPTLRGPFGPDTSHVEIEGFKFQVKSDLNLGVRYRSDGGWGEVADFYPAAAAKAASAPEYRVKVFILENTCIVEKGRDGLWRERIGSLSPAAKEAIYGSLARMKALAETAADGGVRLTFDVTVDSDLLFRVSHEESTAYRPAPTEVVTITAEKRPEIAGLLGPSFIYNEIGPRVNNDAFEAEDGKYRGPYSSVFVIHGMRTWDAATYVLDRTPVSSFSWFTFTDREPGNALSIQLFYAWLQHLGASAKAHLRDVGFEGSLPTGDALPLVPHVFDTPVTSALLAAGNHMASPSYGDGAQTGVATPREFSIEQARGLHIDALPRVHVPDRNVHLHGLIGSVSGDRSYRAVHPAVLSKFMEAHPGAKPYGRIADPSGGWDRVIFGLLTPPDNDCHGLGIEVGNFPAVRLVGQAPTVGKLEFSPSLVGDFSASVESDPTVGPVVVVRESGEDRRGYAVIASTDGTEALFRVEAGTGISFQASCDLIDPYVLRLVTKSGKEIDVQLYGLAPVPSEAAMGAPPVDARKRPVPFWSEFKVPLGAAMDGEEVVEVRLAPPRFAGYYNRASDGTKSLKLGAISFGPVGQAEPAYDEPAKPEIAWLKALRAPLDEAAVLKFREALKNGDGLLRLNALAAMTRVKCPDLYADLGALTASGFYAEAYAAFEALRAQNDDKAWSQIANAAIRGPFGSNYMFAAQALSDKKEDVMLELLGMSQLTGSWHARLAAARAINAVDSERAGVFASATLGGSEEDPCVRFAIASRPRPDSGLFARRLLYAAVNDESEWVRLVGYVSLLDSPAEEIRNEAVKGVRDESVAVRLAVLQEMARRPKEHYRTALRTAVVDREAVVRAAALRAFAAQPGEVVIGEVQNTLSDPSPLVRAALRELAAAKGLTIPPRP